MKLLKEEKFNNTIDGKPVRLFTLRNKSGFAAQFTNYGARWISMWTPDKEGQWADILLGFDSLDGYLNAHEKYYGAIVGRVCGRINEGRFNLKGKEFLLSRNDRFGEPVKNHLHGGVNGFSSRIWEGRIGENENEEEFVELHYLSRDGEEGYPGNLFVRITYTLRVDNAVRIDYLAVADDTTIINLTNHAYFNLSGAGDNKILDHQFYIEADRFIENNTHLTPTGRIFPVADTPLDFNRPKTIRSRMGKSVPGQLFPGKGYVVSYVLKNEDAGTRIAARVEESQTGRFLKLYTDQPVLQFYSGWLLDGSDMGKEGKNYPESGGFALETQGYPDAPNHHGFPSIVLESGKFYRQHSEYHFGNINNLQ